MLVSGTACVARIHMRHENIGNTNKHISLQIGFITTYNVGVTYVSLIMGIKTAIRLTPETRML